MPYIEQLHTDELKPTYNGVCAPVCVSLPILERVPTWPPSIAHGKQRS